MSYIGRLQVFLEVSGSPFDRGVTIRAHENALLSFAARTRDPGRVSAASDAERLGCPVDVMELQRPDVPVIATEDTAPTGLADKDFLD
jgi:hypothetical protein